MKKLIKNLFLLLIMALLYHQKTVLSIFISIIILPFPSYPDHIPSRLYQKNIFRSITSYIIMNRKLSADLKNHRQEKLHHPITFAPSEGTTLNISGVLPNNFVNTARTASVKSFSAPCFIRFTVHPPNPPPVILAPYTPLTERAVPDKISSSGQDTW